MLTSLTQYTRAAIIADVMAFEGGYSNHPGDAGGETNYGVTKVAALSRRADLVRLFNWDGDMRHLTPAMASWIYQMDYWNPLSGDALMALGGKAPLMVDLLYQAGVNMGVRVVSGFFQTVLNVLNMDSALYPDLKVDGALGPVSVGAFQQLLAKRPNDGLKNAIFLVTCEIGHQYTQICVQSSQQERWMAGWSNRARSYLETFVSLY